MSGNGFQKKGYYRGQGLPPQLVARYFRHLGAGSPILDLGCGTGDLGRLRPRRETQVFGIDNDEGAIREASRHENAMVCDIESGKLPFDDGFFEGAVAKDILEHVEKPWALVAELHRVLKPGAKIVVSVPMPYPRVVWQDYTHVRGFTASAIRGLLEDFDFEIAGFARLGGVPLTGRLGLLDWQPVLLRLPGMCRLFGSSWEVVGVRS
jgi:SAM-dependent methyltransferase